MTHLDAPPAPSRREARRLSRRDTILMVAKAYFLEHGYAGTTMSGIAATLGGSKGTLWNYFPSKEELFAALLDRMTTAYRAQLSQILDPCGVLAPTLSRAARNFVEKMTSPDAIGLHRLIISEGTRFPELSQLFFDLAPRHTRAMLADFLEGAMARGQLRPADAADAARVLMALCMTGTHQQLLMCQIQQATDAQIAADADLAVDIFLRAYAPDGSPCPHEYRA